MPVVLIIGTYRQTLTVIRSVARAGYGVILGIYGDSDCVQHSRYIDETWPHSAVDAPRGEFFDELKHFLVERPEVEKIFPVGERELIAFSDHLDRVPPNCDVLMSDRETIRVCLDKPAMSAIVDELDIPQAPYSTVSDSAALFAAADSIGYPCIVKPVNSSVRILNQKAVIFANKEEMKERLETWPSANQSLVIQAYVSGPRHNIYFHANSGRIEALAQVKTLRTDSTDGTGLSVNAVTVTPDPALALYCDKMAERLNYNGAGCAQFLVNESNGLTSFLELNPRLGANFAFVYHAGIDLPLMMLNAGLRKLTNTPVEKKYCKVGVHSAWATGDLIGLKNAIIRGQLSFGQSVSWILAMIKSNLTSSIHITWDWRDPMPTLILAGKSFLLFIAHSIRPKAAARK